MHGGGFFCLPYALPRGWRLRHNDSMDASLNALPRVNVADRLAEQAARAPDQLAVVEAWGKQRSITLAQLDRDADLLARGLVDMGVEPQLRMALLVKPSIEFVTLVFALLRSGATMVLVDSGLGAKNIVRCLTSTAPDGFVAIPLGHLLRILKKREFPKAKLNVNVGYGWLPLGKPLAGLAARGRNSAAELPHTTADDPAAIVFTSGSTGPPKGVVYRHETFATQLSEIERMYALEAGDVDLACFPLFGLFNVALGVTTVLPDMDFSRPAKADPKKLLAAASQFEVDQSFASPAVWDKLSRHCVNTDEQIPTLKKVFSCGAPVAADVIERTLASVHPEAQMHTPYGATESLPVSTIEAKEILNETDERTKQGAGVCVGRKVESIEWRVIEITNEPIATIDKAEELSEGEIGELIVRGPQVSREYLCSPRQQSRGNVTQKEPATTGVGYNNLAKIKDDDTIWHRMGDVGYLDDQGRFWYCGRKSQRVVTSEGTLYTECVEQMINSRKGVYRSALVGVGKKDDQRPCIVWEPSPDVRLDDDYDSLKFGEQHGEDLNLDLKDWLKPQLYPHSIGEIWPSAIPLPTDIRHNAKINREKLAKWAAKKLDKEH